MVIHYRRMTRSHKAADDVAAHPAEADHSHLHLPSPVSTGAAASILLCTVKYAAMPKIKQI
jgi:hypothetical protein